MSVTEISATECRQCNTVTLRSSGLCRRCDPSSKLNRGKVCVADRKPVADATPVVNEFGVEVGDVFYNSWGYDQTNIDYYKVIRVTAKMAEIVPIGATATYRGGPSGDRVKPDPDVIREWDVITGIGQERWLGDGKGYGPALKSKLCRTRMTTWRSEPSALIVLSGEHTAERCDPNEDRYQTDTQFGH